MVALKRCTQTFQDCCEIGGWNVVATNGWAFIRSAAKASSCFPKTSTAYAVGILTRNELHLNPVHTVVQLRPSMKHLQALSKKSNTARDEEEQAIKQNSKKQSKLPGAVNEQNVDAKEKWISLEYHGETSRLSRGYMGNMIAQQASQIQFSMSPYVTMLILVKFRYMNCWYNRGKYFSEARAYLIWPYLPSNGHDSKTQEELMNTDDVIGCVSLELSYERAPCMRGRGIIAKKFFRKKGLTDNTDCYGWDKQDF
ncbi:DNA-directed RNA polymerase III subunit RPC5 [Artemisia annua]|uniref:DNA-directed RNA polymerase III subunit RPC5 n=1 Tax=Artemisia annua TaxID=35608 RepID=A0A2U1LBX0_ARTAN|nr:DNA-directed RNA polymerase III subunit RPC5 [Artemisia annua]